MIIGLFVADPDKVTEKAVAAGATETSRYKTMTMVTGRQLLQTRLNVTGLSKKELFNP